MKPPRQHTFVSWLGLPENDVYRAFLHGYIDSFPPGGDREHLRAVVAADDRELAKNEWHPLDLFDHAWAAFRPQCAWPDCKNFVGLRADFCNPHLLEALL